MFDAGRARLLEAMGYQLLQRVAAGPPSVAPAAAAPPPQQQPTVEPPRSPPTAAAPAIAPVAVPVHTDPLWNALLRAAALDPQRADANGLRLATSGVAVEYIRDELWIDPVALRSDARGKRALWKTLRALRRAELQRTQ